MLSLISRRGPIPIFTLGGLLDSFTRGETTSYTDSATVITAFPSLNSDSSAITRLIDGTYNSYLVIDSPTISPWFKIDLAISRYVNTVFIASGPLGTTRICVGDNSASP